MRMAAIGTWTGSSAVSRLRRRTPRRPPQRALARRPRRPPALMYTYSGAAPQNPNLDPILFAELPWFSNFEVAQMTKWGMPGVYTHAFMDGWSPGYLGSVAYNHNGIMRMYETQSGREAAPGPGSTGARGLTGS